jgi:hypothetical protein
MNGAVPLLLCMYSCGIPLSKPELEIMASGNRPCRIVYPSYRPDLLNRIRHLRVQERLYFYLKIWYSLLFCGWLTVQLTTQRILSDVKVLTEPTTCTIQSVSTISYRYTYLCAFSTIGWYDFNYTFALIRIYLYFYVFTFSFKYFKCI